VLVELGLVEQRYRAVLEVLEDGASVTDVARRYGVGRQAVHAWLRRYASEGLSGLVDRSARPDTCPHQMPPAVEARVLEMRRFHPGWGPRTILNRLAREGVEPLPGRSSIYRALVRHHLIEPAKRRRRASDYKRWERARPMELWQMDITAGVLLADGTTPSLVTGVDDHSRFCVCAKVVLRATAKPVCDALRGAMEAHGMPEAILTDIQADCALGSTVRPAGGGKLRGDRCPLCIAADRSERLTTPCLLGVSRAGATPGKETSC
jgi:transposase